MKLLAKKRIKLLLSVLLGMALFDLIATIVWVDGKFASEANPILDYFIQRSVILFAVVKLSFTFIGVLILQRFKEFKTQLIFDVSLILVAIYSILTCYHLIGVVEHLL